ncbi:hypothetical protein [Deinococcus hopiensis]|uniref:hypothetical protein n=1 Tax=Deinococcus hopiensis TaxID=309885 RepID=UPI000A013E1C|nr:hypothetical protein [Deinococcus hopiensis]
MIAVTRSPAGQPYGPYGTRVEVRKTATEWGGLPSRVQPANGDGETMLLGPGGQTLWSAHAGTARHEARSGTLIGMAVGSCRSRDRRRGLCAA